MVKILFVDDDVMLLKLIDRKLYTNQITKLFASNLKEAYGILANNKDIGIVFVDLKLVDSNGFELLQYLKQSYPDVIKVVMSSHINLDLVLALVNKYDVYKVLAKPVNFEKDFIEIINASMNKSIYNINRFMNNNNQQNSQILEKKIDALALESIERDKLFLKFVAKMNEYIIGEKTFLEIVEYVEEIDQDIYLDRLKDLTDTKNEIRNIKKVIELGQVEEKKDLKTEVKKILIVDDSLENRKVTATLIKKYTDYKVILAKSGEDVLKMMEENRLKNVGLALVDVMMTGISGYDLAKELRRNNLTKDISIIMLSALVQNQKKQRMNDTLKIEDYIIKPINKDKLIPKVEKYVNSRGNGNEI